jgi:outer membrane protein TolC
MGLKGEKFMHIQVTLTFSLIILVHPVKIGLAGSDSQIHQEIAADVSQMEVVPKDNPSQEASAPLEPVELRLIGKEQLPINLPTALRLATANNLEIAEARAQVLEAKGNSSAAKGLLIPGVSLFFFLGRTDGRVQGSFGELRDVTFNTVNPGVVAGYFLNPGEAIFNALAAHRIVDATSANESAVTQDVLLEVAEGYYDLVEAQTKVKVAEKSVSDSKTLLKIAEVLEKQGIGPGVDVARAQAKLAGDEQALIQAQNEFREASVNLALTLKLDSSVTLFPQDKEVRQISLVDPQIGLDELINTALEKHPELRRASQEIKAREAEESGAWLGALGPEVLLEAQVSGIGTEFANIGESEVYQALIGVSISASSYGQIKAARARVRRARVLDEKTREEIRASVVKAYDDVLSAKEEITPTRKEVEAAEESLKLSQVRFKRGLGLAIEVIQAEDALADARLNYIKTIVGYNKAQARLLNELGEISIDSMVRGIQ